MFTTEIRPCVEVDLDECQGGRESQVGTCSWRTTKAHVMCGKKLKHIKYFLCTDCRCVLLSVDHFCDSS